MKALHWDPLRPPFSFVYGGRPAGALLPDWDSGQSVERTEEGSLSCLRSADPETGLEVTARVRTFADFPATEWVLEFANNGSADTPILEDILPLDVTWARPAGEAMTLHHARGSLCQMDDFLPLTDALPPGRTLALAPVGGRSSNGVLPFMNLQWAGGGMVLAVGWSGQWRAAFERTPEGLRVAAGMERTHLRLRPGERIRTPRILLAEWEGNDPLAGNNLLRRLILAHYTPRPAGEPALPPVAHMTMSTFHHTRKTDEANELDALAHARALGAEAYWVDACWYGEGGSWWEEVGNWKIHRGRFPNGLAPIGEAAREAGMKFVLWFEPERVRQETPLAREHPEFLIRLPGNENLLFNLGNPQALAHMTDLISGVIADAGVTIYRQDHNFDPLPYWQAADAPDRAGMSEIRHVEGLYALWDELRRRHPGLLIDNCASGGRRIDLETTARAFPLWRSDFSDVGGPGHGFGLQIGDQLQTAGLSRWVPLHAAAVWSFTPYTFWSAMSTGTCLYCDVRGEAFPSEAARAAIACLKRLRPFALGDFTPLVPLTTAAHDWCAYQYHRPDLDAGFALFLRRHESRFPRLQAALKGIDPEGEYAVGTATDFAEPPRRLLRGADLARLEVEVPEAPGALLVEYRRAGG